MKNRRRYVAGKGRFIISTNATSHLSAQTTIPECVLKRFSRSTTSNDDTAFPFKNGNKAASRTYAQSSTSPKHGR